MCNGNRAAIVSHRLFDDETSSNDDDTMTMQVCQQHTLATANWFSYFSHNMTSANSMDFSITPALTAEGCVLCSPPPSTRLGVLSDISKLDCTGQKSR